MIGECVPWSGLPAPPAPLGGGAVRCGCGPYPALLRGPVLRRLVSGGRGDLKEVFKA